jgi:hypothetical protein
MFLVVRGSSVLKKFNHNILPYAQEAYSGGKAKRNTKQVVTKLVITLIPVKFIPIYK